MEDLKLDQVDFKSAYLNGEIEEEIYIELPDGYKQGNKVCCDKIIITPFYHHIYKRKD